MGHVGNDGGQFLIAGIGGQGVVTAASVLSRTATDLGMKVLGSETHGMSQRGGSVVSHWKVGTYQAPLIRKGAADCLLAFNDLEGYRNLDFVKAGGKALFNAPDGRIREPAARFLADQGVEVQVIDALAIVAERKAYKALNLLMLGFASSAGWLPFTAKSLEATVGSFGKPQFREANLWAFNTGARMGREATS